MPRRFHLARRRAIWRILGPSLVWSERKIWRPHMTLDPASLVDAEGRPIDDKLFDDYEVYSLELQRIFTRCWLFLGHESQIPEPGDFVQSRLGYQPMILARNADGEIRAFRNYC